MSLIHPEGFGDDFQAWADQMSFLVQEEVPQFLIFTPTVGDEWQDWAESLFGSEDPLGQDSPDPRAFDTWQEWAERLFGTTNFTG